MDFGAAALSTVFKVTNPPNYALNSTVAKLNVWLVILLSPAAVIGSRGLWLENGSVFYQYAV